MSFLSSLFKLKKEEKTKKESSVSTIISEKVSINSSYNALYSKDEYVIAAFINYCNFGGRVLGDSSSDYPRYFEYDFGLLIPKSYSKYLG